MEVNPQSIQHGGLEMLGRRAAKNLSWTVSLLAVAVSSADPLSSAAEPLPPEVAEFIVSRGVAEVREMTSEWTVVDGIERRSSVEGKSFSLGQPFTVFTFSESFLRGDAQAVAVEPNGTWISPVIVEGVPSATALMWREEGRGIAIAEVSEDPQLAQSLVELGDTSTLVLDAPISTWFSLEGDRLRPVGANQARPLQLSDYAKVLAEYHEKADRSVYNEEDPLVGGADYGVPLARGLFPGLWVGSFVVGAALVATAVFRSRRVSR